MFIVSIYKLKFAIIHWNTTTDYVCSKSVL